MARNKVSRKQLLKEPDEFLTFSGRLLNLCIEYRIQVLGLLAALFAVVLIASGVRYFAEKGEDKAFALMRQGVDRYEASLKEGDAEKAYQAVSADFQTLLSEYSGREGGKLARITYANMAYKAGDLDKAIPLYEKALDDFGDRPSLKNLILNSLGYCYEGKKDYPAAVRYFEMISNGAGTFMKGTALFNLGRLYAQTGDAAKSKAAFEKLVADYPDSTYVDLVREQYTAGS